MASPVAALRGPLQNGIVYAHLRFYATRRRNFWFAQCATCRGLYRFYRQKREQEKEGVLQFELPSSHSAAENATNIELSKRKLDMKERQLKLAEKKPRLDFGVAADIEELDPCHSQRQCLEDAITKQQQLLKECVQEKRIAQ